MSKHIRIEFEIKEWESDGDTLKRQVSLRTTGGLERLTWGNLQIHGRQLTARETELISTIQQAVDELAKGD